MNRRRFTFWVGFGLFSAGCKLRLDRLDELAASLMRRTEPSPTRRPAAPDADAHAVGSAALGPHPVHWRAAHNELWRWFERETYADGQWTLSGITTPINKDTGLPYLAIAGYLAESDVPEEVRKSILPDHADRPTHAEHAADDFSKHHATEARRARHGRPPSKWLRSLYADELRIWMKTITVPEADVAGMTYWTHLTRDHLFDADHIAGLTEPEQAKLHGAAHYGY